MRRQLRPHSPKSQKAVQCTLKVVAGGLSLISIFINVAVLALLDLRHKEIIEADNGANVALVGE